MTLAKVFPRAVRRKHVAKEAKVMPEMHEAILVKPEALPFYKANTADFPFSTGGNAKVYFDGDIEALNMTTRSFRGHCICAELNSHCRVPTLLLTGRR